MRNYEEILKSLGIEIPTDKLDELKTAMNANYKTISEFEKVKEKRDEYKTELDKFAGVDVENLKKQLADEKAGRAADKRAAEIDKALSGKTFVNSLTEESIRAKIAEALTADDKKTAADVLKSLTTGEDGKDLPDIFKSAEPAGGTAGAGSNVRFTSKKHSDEGGTVYKSKKDIMAIKNTSARRKAIQDHPEFFTKQE